MHVAMRYPQSGGFITTVGTRIAARGGLIDRVLTRDLGNAVKAKQVVVNDLLVARDLVLGAIFYGIETMLTEPTQSITLNSSSRRA